MKYTKDQILAAYDAIALRFDMDPLEMYPSFEDQLGIVKDLEWCLKEMEFDEDAAIVRLYKEWHLSLADAEDFLCLLQKKLRNPEPENRGVVTEPRALLESK